MPVVHRHSLALAPSFAPPPTDPTGPPTSPTGGLDHLLIRTASKPTAPGWLALYLSKFEGTQLHAFRKVVAKLVTVCRVRAFRKVVAKLVTVCRVLAFLPFSLPSFSLSLSLSSLSLSLPPPSPRRALSRPPSLIFLSRSLSLTRAGWHVELVNRA